MGSRGGLYPTLLDPIWNHFQGVRQNENGNGTPAEMAISPYHPQQGATHHKHCYHHVAHRTVFYSLIFLHYIQTSICSDMIYKFLTPDSICSGFSAQNPSILIIYCENSVKVGDFTRLALVQTINLHTSYGSRNRTWESTSNKSRQWGRPVESFTFRASGRTEERGKGKRSLGAGQ